MPDNLKPPPRLNMLRELAAGIDMIGSPRALAEARLTRKAKGTGRAVMVMPGFGGNDSSTLPLRYFLAQHGHMVEGWGIGTNKGGRGLISDVGELSDRWEIDRQAATPQELEVPALCDKMYDVVKKRSETLELPLSLIGWSLGGYIAREVARDLPDHVEAVITLGSPLYGGPKYTALAPIYRARKYYLDRMEEEIERRSKRPITQPVTAIYSKYDGIVGWKAAIDDESENVRNIEVNISHIGLGLNARVWRLVADALASVRDRAN